MRHDDEGEEEVKKTQIKTFVGINLDPVVNRFLSELCIKKSEVCDIKMLLQDDGDRWIMVIYNECE